MFVTAIVALAVAWWLDRSRLISQLEYIEAKLMFDVGQGTQDLGFRNSVPILFDCQKAFDVRLRVRDETGKPTTAAFVVRDHLERPPCAAAIGAAAENKINIAIVSTGL